MKENTVADQGFSGGVGNSKGGRENLLFGQLFPRNSIKMKEIEPRGGSHVPNHLTPILIR